MQANVTAVFEGLRTTRVSLQPSQIAVTARCLNIEKTLVMLEQLARVLCWLCVGEIASRSGFVPLPAPVTGLILLYAELAARGELPPDLGALADRLLQLLGMFFVPAGVGVIAHLSLLKAEAVPILAAVIGGTAITLFVTMVVVNRLGFASTNNQRHSTDSLEGIIRDVKS
jgi:holin-like protein